MKFLITILILFASITNSAAAQKSSGNFSKLIVGQWQLDSQPLRFPKYLADGTWTLQYAGNPSVQSGRWRVEDHKLHRYYTNGEVRISNILALNRSEMVLKTFGQVDVYKRILYYGPARIAH